MRAAKPEMAEIEQANRDDKNEAQTIIEVLSQFINRFVLLPTPEMYTLVSAWVIATYLHGDFDYLGYLLAYSPEKESGKTTLLKVLDLVVYQSTGVQVSPTSAVLFRTAKDHTQLLDEVDSWTNDADLKDVLNAGYERGGVVTRCDRNTTGFKPTTFPVFAPRALAGIGHNKLHQTTLDRTFAIAMVRQMKTEKREHLRPRKIRDDAVKIKEQLVQWVKNNGKNVATFYEDADFAYLNRFGDRTIDISEPLAAIVEVAYRKNPKHAEATKSLVSAIAATRREQAAPSPGHKHLRHLLLLAETEDPLTGSPSELAAHCANFDPCPNARDMARLLKDYGFVSKSCRKPGDDSPRYRYVLTRAKLQEVVERWVPAEILEAVPAVEAEEVAAGPPV